MKHAHNTVMPLNLEWERYAPEFSEKDHHAAQEEGYADALDRWVADMEFEQYKHHLDSDRRRTKAQTIMDLETVGTPPDELGALGNAVLDLPGVPDYQPSQEAYVPRDPYVRKAALQGIKNRLAHVLERMEERGIPWDTNSPEDGLTGEDREWSTYYEKELEAIGMRLEAHGENLHDLIAQAQRGGLAEQEFYTALPEPENAELRRVYGEYARAHEQEQANEPDDWDDEWDEESMGNEEADE